MLLQHNTLDIRTSGIFTRMSYKPEQFSFILEPGLATVVPEENIFTSERKRKGLEILAPKRTQSWFSPAPKMDSLDYIESWR